MATLTTAEILVDLMDAFKKSVPALNTFTTDFSSERVKYNQQIIAHIASLPSAVDHNQSNGYFQNMGNARDLLTDVPVVINEWKDVNLKFRHADLIADRSTKYTETVNNAAYVLGKSMVDSVMAKIVAANISYSSVCANASANYSKLRTFATKLNANGAAFERYLLTSPEFMSGLLADTIIASGDYFNQRQSSSPFATLTNVAGFREINEYVDFPGNSENLTAFGYEKRAVIIASRLPQDSVALAQERGVPVDAKIEVQTDADSGLSVLAIERLNTTTMDLELTFSVMWGSVVGRQGSSNAAGSILDKAGLRIITAAPQA